MNFFDRQDKGKVQKNKETVQLYFMFLYRAYLVLHGQTVRLGVLEGWKRGKRI